MVQYARVGEMHCVTKKLFGFGGRCRIIVRFALVICDGVRSGT